MGVDGVKLSYCLSILIQGLVYYGLHSCTRPHVSILGGGAQHAANGECLDETSCGKEGRCH